MEDRHIPNLALAEFHAGQVHTSYCSSGPVTTSPDSVFEAASLGKPIFAAGVLQLVLQHRLDLDVPLSRYIRGPYRHERNPFKESDISTTDVVTDPRMAKVTARMVLTHTSGLPNWSRSGPLTFLSEPDTTWSYSGEGFLYLQRAVEALTQQPIERLLEQTVLRPLGMTHSSFVWKQVYQDHVLTGHSVSGSVVPTQQYLRAVVSTTLYTTLEDYARFVSALISPKPGSSFAMEETAQVAVRPDLNLSWGLGLAVEHLPKDSFFHWGANPGFQGFFLCQPSGRRGVLFLTDSDNGLDLVGPIVGHAVPGVHPSLSFPMLHPSQAAH